MRNDMRNNIRSLFVLAGIALVIAGLSGPRPLVFVGAGLIVLALVSKKMGR